MSKLYETCPVCDGTGLVMIKTQMLVFDFDKHEVRCGTCRGSGFVETGLTTGQVEAIVARERARLGDPGAGPTVTLRFRTAEARENFLVGLMAECLDDHEHVGVVMIRPASGGTIVEADMIDVEMEGG